MKTLLATLFTISSLIGGTASAKEDENTYTFVGFGLTQFEELKSLKLNDEDVDIVPEFFIGLGKEIEINESWEVNNEIALRHSKAHFSNATLPYDLSSDALAQSRFSGNIDSTGLWVSSRLKFVGLEAKVSPFVELSVGAVRNSYDTPFNNNTSHGFKYKSSYGLEFKTSSDIKFSFALGDSDNF